jgi:hypothetical protein
MMNLQDEITDCKLRRENMTAYIEMLEEKQAKELEKPKSKRILSGEQEHGVFCVTRNGFVSRYTLKELIKNDNAFIDEESAQLQAQRNTLVHKMRVAAAECPVDLVDKYYLTWRYPEKNYHIVIRNSVRYSQLPNFSCKTKLEIFMNSLLTDEQELLICGVE